MTFLKVIDSVLNQKQEQNNICSGDIKQAEIYCFILVSIKKGYKLL
jgi:hypothetical protein